jgi:hypothetical protein
MARSSYMRCISSATTSRMYVFSLNYHPLAFHSSGSQILALLRYMVTEKVLALLHCL